MKKTVNDFADAKREGRRLTMLTAYDYSTARIIDRCDIDAVLVGDSLGMTMLGMPDTLSVTLDDMIRHTRAVSRGTKEAFVVADMPFMSYQTSCEQALENAGRLVKEAGAQAVKLEGGAVFAKEIEAIRRASIPVMGHLGLTPQSINDFGGFKVQGKTKTSAQGILDDARAIEEAGAFCIVLECIPPELAALVTKTLSIPTIGIGSGADCDGQVLVYHDILGMYGDFKPKFVKRFAEIGSAMELAFNSYAEEVRKGTFPAAEHCFSAPPGIFDELR